MARRVKFMVVLAICGFWAGSGMADSTADSLERRVQNAIDHNHIVDNLGTGFQNQPSGEFLLAPQNRNLHFGIIIYNIDIYPSQAVFSAGLAFRDHRSNQLIAFKADKVVFSFNHGISGNVKLHLLDSVQLTLGKMATLLFTAGPQASYATFNCQGLSDFSMMGQARFNSKYLLPVSDSGSVLENTPLTTHFSFYAQNWADVVVELSIPPFQFKGLKEFEFEAQRAVLDLSETANAPGFFIPDAYASMGFSYPNPALWEGFYLQKGTVRLPKHFHSTETGRVSFGFSRVLIDDFGFTGTFTAENILSLQQGSIAGWGMSIAQIQLEFVMNRIQQARMGGLLNLPVLPDTSHLIYQASIGMNDYYLFTIGNQSNIAIPALKAAQVILTKSSYVSAEIVAGKIGLEANLNGTLTATSKANEGENTSEFHIPQIRFQGMRMSNTSPKFDIAYLGILNTKDTASMGRYPLQLQSLSFTTAATEYILNAKIRLNLTEYATATSEMKLICQSVKAGLRDKVVYKRVQLSSLQVGFEKSGIGVYGLLNFFRADPDYGNGCQGTIYFQLNEPKIKASARALFGNISSTRYWYFDAEVLWPAPGIMLSPGVNINGFVGGAWHRLKPAGINQNLQHPEYGKTASGVVLVPSADAGLGLRAGAYLNGGTEQSYQAKTVLEMHFLKTGALAKTLFYGDIEVMPSKTNNTLAAMAQSHVSIPSVGSAWTNYCKAYQPSAQIGGPFMLDLDFVNHTYYAGAGLYIKNAGANTINGMYEQFKAGELVAYFSKSKWYFRVGHPEQPLGVKVSVGKMAGISATSYILLGTEIPKALLPPAEIRQYLGQNLTLDNKRDVTAQAEGKGFAYGMGLAAKASAGGSDKKLSIYANLNAKAAMDVNVKKYNKNVVCQSTGQTPGLNGWFGEGNLYAFLQGKIGASAGKFSVDVMTFTGAMQMNFRGPNPIFAAGSTYIGFNLGGIFKFKGYMDVKLGESCNPQIQNYTDSNILKSTTPLHLTRNFDPLGSIAASFHVPIDQAFDAGNGKNMMFRMRKNELIQGGKTISGNWKFIHNNMDLIFESKIPLNPLQEATWNMEFDLVEINGKTFTQMQYKGKPMEEIHSIKFTTADLPKNIPLTNIASSWPIPDQLHFYKGESSQGVIELKRKQDYLFTKSGTKVIARFTSNSGAFLGETQVSYNSGRLVFNIPTNMQLGTIYKLRIVRVNQTYNLNIGPTVSATLGASGISTVTTMAPKAATASTQELLLEFWFRSSIHSTFKDKINSMAVTSVGQPTATEMEIKITPTKGEYFDCFEINGELYGLHLGLVADLNQTLWYIDEIQKKINSIYKAIPSSVLLKRDTSIYGFNPTKAIIFRQTTSDILRLNSDHIYQNKSIIYKPNDWLIHYQSADILATDFNEIKQSLMNLYGNAYPNIQSIMSSYISILTKSTPSTGSTKMVGTSNPRVSSAASFGAKSTAFNPSVLTSIPFPSLYKPSSYPLVWTMEIKPITIKTNHPQVIYLK